MFVLLYFQTFEEKQFNTRSNKLSLNFLKIGEKQGTMGNNSKIIGIPRAMSYYNNYPFYYGFFSSLGFEIVLSDKTTTTLINEGSHYVVSDTCLPIDK